MRKAFFFLLTVFCFLAVLSPAFGATKITELTEDVAPTSDDLAVTVNNPGGTPATRKVTLSNLKVGALLANGANCAAGEIPLGVNAAGAVEGCYEPSEADISDLAHTATDITADIVDFNDIKYDNTLAGNPTLLVDECYLLSTIGGGGFICEGSTADTNEQLYLFPDANGADTTEYIVVADDANVSSTEAGYLDGVTSAIQTQIDSKEGTLTNEAGLYSALSDVSDFTQPGVAETITANWVNTANPWADNEVADDITASSYLPLAGGTMTAEFTADDLGIEFTAGDAITDCTSFSATGGGIFYDDSEGKFKKCQDNTLTDLDTGGAETNSLEADGAVGILDTEIYIGTGAGTGNYAAMGGDASMTSGGVVTIGNDKILEAHLKAVDAAVDEECLTYESTTGDFEWQACGSGSPGGADTQIQYNNGGAFGGVASFIYDDTNIELADDFSLAFGTAADWTINFDDSVDDQLLFSTAKTASIATGDAMVEFLFDTGAAGMTADQQIFGLAVGSQATNTEKFTVDEDGDGVFAGTVTIGGTAQSTITEGLVVNNGSGADEDDDFLVKGGTANLIDCDAGDDNCIFGTGILPPKLYSWSASDTLATQPNAAGFDGIAPLSKDDGTNVEVMVALFDDTADECRGVSFKVPEDVDTTGTAQFHVSWYSGTATTGNVGWYIAWHEVNEGESWDSTTTTDSATADATQGTVDLVTETTWTETMTNLGWTADETVTGWFCRDGAAASDMTGDASALQFSIEVPRI